MKYYYRCNNPICLYYSQEIESLGPLLRCSHCGKYNLELIRTESTEQDRVIGGAIGGGILGGFGGGPVGAFIGALIGISLAEKRNAEERRKKRGY